MKIGRLASQIVRAILSLDLSFICLSLSIYLKDQSYLSCNIPGTFYTAEYYDDAMVHFLLSIKFAEKQFKVLTLI
jgi:hypothetical protein